MNLLGRKKSADAELVSAPAEQAPPEPSHQPGATAPKGRPTPKRDAARRRGPVPPAPMTAAEARRRRKIMRGPKLSREERIQRRGLMAERRQRMMAGEEAYLLSRDRGPVRRFVRDVVDARRNVLGLFMPSALGLLFVMMLAPPQLQMLISPAMMVLILIMAIDGMLLARKVNRLVDEKFPTHTEGFWRLGLYAANRASQLRRMRAPRPGVNRGDPVG